MILNQNECKFEILNEEDEQKSELDLLRCLITREHNDFYSIADLVLSKNQVVDQHVNLLFAVRQIGEIENLQTKKGTTLKKLELLIFDQTKTSFKLTLWDKELIRYAQTWRPMSDSNLNENF